MTDVGAFGAPGDGAGGGSGRRLDGSSARADGSSGRADGSGGRADGPGGRADGSGARIFDQGYRHYDGRRLGSRGAMRAVYKAAVQRSLGLKRSARFKVVPVVTAAMAYVPAMVFVGVAALLPDQLDDVVPDYAGYYTFVTAAIVLFVAFVAPEVLCTDRRSGMLGLYLAGPLSRDQYLAAKSAAVATVIAVVTLGPPVLLLVGYTFADVGPGSFPSTLKVLVQIIAAAAVVTVWYTVISLAVSSLTDRRSFASAGIILLVLVSSSVVSALVRGADLSPWLRLADVFILPFELVRRVYGDEGEQELAELGTARLALGALVIAAGAVVLLRSRYRRLTVTR
jgi:ABC-2 type transport system permease protein